MFFIKHGLSLILNIFFRTTGVVHIDATGKDEKINNKYYIELIVSSVVPEI
jgi:hypothetical protein